MRIVVAVLAFIFIGLQVELWFGDEGVRRLLVLQRQIDEQKSANEKDRERNEALAAEVEDLKTGKAAIEERARSELGMIKKGEVFYQVIEPESDKQ